MVTNLGTTATNQEIQHCFANEAVAAGDVVAFLGYVFWANTDVGEKIISVELRDTGNTNDYGIAMEDCPAGAVFRVVRRGNVLARTAGATASDQLKSDNSSDLVPTAGAGTAIGVALEDSTAGLSMCYVDFPLFGTYA